MLPAGAKVAFTGSADVNDYPAIWAALTRCMASTPTWSCCMEVRRISVILDTVRRSYNHTANGASGTSRLPKSQVRQRGTGWL
jgi:hypothetical protein